MLNITIIAVGKLKEKYLSDAQSEYLRRLTTYCVLTLVELPEAKLPPDPSDAEITAALESEAKQIAAKIPPSAFVIPLCVEGSGISSEALAEKISRLAVDGRSRLCFIIGGSFGLHHSVKSLGGLLLSMSKMTFPHHLARVMLLEQIYRSLNLLGGGKYHK